MIPLSEPSLGGRELEYVTRCLTTGWISSNGEFVSEMEKVRRASSASSTSSPAIRAPRPSTSR